MGVRKECLLHVQWHLPARRANAGLLGLDSPSGCSPLACAPKYFASHAGGQRAGNCHDVGQDFLWSDLGQGLKLASVGAQTGQPAPAAGPDLASIGAKTGVHRLQGLNLASVGAETDRRGFVPVNEKMQVLDTKGKPVPGVWCIGDANGEMQPQHSVWLAETAVWCMAAISVLLRAALHVGMLGTSWLPHMPKLLSRAVGKPALLHMLQASTCLHMLPAPRASVPSRTCAGAHMCSTMPASQLPASPTPRYILLWTQSVPTNSLPRAH